MPGIKSRIIYFSVTLIFVSLCCRIPLMACKPHQSDTKNASPSSLPIGVVIFKTEARTLRVQVEIVKSEKDRAKGLMYRKELGAHKGMLFIFDSEEIQSFWMKNTYIPLDMIFINKKMEVVGVIENASPMTTNSRSVSNPSIYVVEVNAGYAKQYGITRGTKVGFEGVGGVQ